jgi:hypothetical protein
MRLQILVAGGILTRVRVMKVKPYNNCSCQVTLPKTVVVDSPSLVIPMWTLDYGQYCLYFRSRYRCAPGEGWVNVDLNVTSTPLKALISGGDERLAMTGDVLVFDGSPSYDPDVEKSQQPQLSYSWTCRYAVRRTNFTINVY